MTPDPPNVPDTVPETSNHQLYIPEKGRGDWHKPLNANWHALDAEIEIRDLDENKSSYAAEEDSKFFATDTGNIYIGDGDTWNHVVTTTIISDSGSFSHTGGSPTTITVNNVTENELASLDVSVGLASAPSWDGDYGYNYDWARYWDDDAGHVNITITVNWNGDPGPGKDLNLQYKVSTR